MEKSSTRTNTDRTSEVLENIELLFGSLLSNSPILTTDQLLSERANSIYKQIKNFRYDYLKTHNQ